MNGFVSLTKRGDILKVKSSPYRAFSRFLVVQALFLAYDVEPKARLALVLVVSKRIGIAVVRNKVKRLLRVAISQLLSEMPGLFPLHSAQPSCLHCAIVARVPIASASLLEIKQQLVKCLSYINIRQNNAKGLDSKSYTNITHYASKSSRKTLGILGGQVQSNCIQQKSQKKENISISTSD